MFSVSSVVKNPARLIGILGGTFDPIHFGHLRPALEVRQGLGLDEVRLIPLRDPPHRGRPRADAGQRLQMVRLAAADQAGFVVDDRELRREGLSYTLDTLRSLRGDLDEGGHICILLGSDALLGFPDWHEPDEVLKLAHLIVMHRPGADVSGEPALQALLAQHRTRDPGRLRDQAAGAILFHPVTQLEISATKIRRLVRSGRSARYLLPDVVLDLIVRWRLYA